MADSGRSERLAEWLDARLRDVDVALAARVRSAVTAVSADGTLDETPELLLRAAVAQLEPLAVAGCVGRESAIDLLAVDTLVTLACEALADSSATSDAIAERATAMMRSIAATMPQLDGAA